MYITAKNLVYYKSYNKIYIKNSRGTYLNHISIFFTMRNDGVLLVCHDRPYVCTDTNKFVSRQTKRDLLGE